MNEQLSIETPEQIDISFQKAGIGSRFYAALIDTLLLGLILFVGYYVNRNFMRELGDVLGNWLGALGGIIVFALFWGYYMVYEVTTNGQSLGKRALGLRVIKDGGYPIGFADSAVRNLVRLVDFLPFFYGAGLLAMLITKDWQRLGGPGGRDPRRENGADRPETYRCRFKSNRSTRCPDFTTAVYL